MKTIFFLKRSLLLVTIIGFTCSTFAQEKDHALASIEYEFVHVTDTTRRENPRKERMILYLGKSMSLYKSKTLALKLAEIKKEMGEEFNEGNKKRHLSFNAPNIATSELFLSPQQQQMRLVDKIGPTEYLIPEDYPMIQWTINSQTKVIGGYNCQQATGDFGGRTYLAWFTAEIPFPYGPWKLHGLPGLILQASDATNDVQFNYAGFKKELNDTITIALPKEAQQTTWKDFTKAKIAFEKNLMFNHKALASPNANTKIVLKDQSGRQLSEDEFSAMRESRANEKKNKPNNPLELDKK